MRLWQGIATAGLAIALANTAWLYTRHQQEPDRLSPEDRLEIQQLYAYYARDVDSGSRRDASWMYTEDGVWDVAGMRVEGKEALKEWYATVPPGVSKNGIRHFSTNLILVPTDKGVRGSAYMMGVERKTEGGPIEITMFGKYEDLLVETDRGWRFKKRRWRSDTYHGDDKSLMPSPYEPVE